MSDLRYLRKGSIVTIVLDKSDKTVTPGMLEYDGQRAAIARVCKPKRSPLVDGYVYGYELDGVTSQYGVPYTFTRDMIY